MKTVGAKRKPPRSWSCWTCQACGGLGGKEALSCYLWIECEWCRGTGFITSRRRIEWLNMKKAEKEDWRGV